MFVPHPCFVVTLFLCAIPPMYDFYAGIIFFNLPPQPSFVCLFPVAGPSNPSPFPALAPPSTPPLPTSTCLSHITSTSTTTHVPHCMHILSRLSLTLPLTLPQTHIAITSALPPAFSLSPSAFVYYSSVVNAVHLLHDINYPAISDLSSHLPVWLPENFPWRLSSSLMTPTDWTDISLLARVVRCFKFHPFIIFD